MPSFAASAVRALVACGLLAGTALLSACGPHMVSSNVLRFNDMAATPAGGTFAILPEKDQEGSLEFRAYADMVARRLEILGYKRAANPDKADLAVSLDYTVDDGRVETWSTPIYSYNDYWRRFYGRAADWPPAYIEPLGSDTHSTTVFTHRLDLSISDARKLRQGKRENVFEGRAVAERATREPVTTIPILIQALFENFPGQNGIPTTIRLPELRSR